MFDTYHTHYDYGERKSCNECGYISGPPYDREGLNRHIVHTVRESNIRMEALFASGRAREKGRKAINGITK